jgi:hypothetical protein
MGIGCWLRCNWFAPGGGLRLHFEEFRGQWQFRIHQQWWQQYGQLERFQQFE